LGKTEMMRRFGFALVTVTLLAACARDVVQHREDSGGATLPAQARCTTDADCRLVSDYCDGCACRALAASEQPPKCQGTTVQCFVDPCQRHRAACQSGACVDVK
jgi:hypothetical protein